MNIFLPRWTTFKFIVVLCAFKELLWHKFAVIKFCSFQTHESAADRISLVLCDSKSIQKMLIEYLWWCNKISFYVISHAVQNINDRKLGPYMKWIGKQRATNTWIPEINFSTRRSRKWVVFRNSIDNLRYCLFKYSFIVFANLSWNLHEQWGSKSETMRNVVS